MTNTEMLEDLIRSNGLKKNFLAGKIGLTPAGFRNCIINKSEFKASQINTLCELLGIDDLAVKEAIFFAEPGA